MKAEGKELLIKCLRHPVACTAGTCARVTLRWLWYLGGVAVILVVIAVAVLRLWLPTLGERKAELEAYLSAKAARPIHIVKLEAYWKGLHPRLRAEGLTVLSADGSKVMVKLDEARLRLAWVPLLYGELVFDELTLLHPMVQLTRLKDGRIAVAGIAPAPTRKKSDPVVFLGWLLRQNDIDIRDGEINWVDRQANAPALHVTHIDLSLTGSDDRHKFSASAMLPDRICKNLRIVAELNGNPFEDSSWSGKLFVQTTRLDVAQLPAVLREHFPRGMTGRLDARLWTEWDQDRLTKANGFIGVANLKLVLPVFTKPLVARTLNSDITWQGGPDGWQLTLDPLHVDLAGERWPTTKLEVKSEHKAQRTTLTIGHLRAGALTRLVDMAKGEEKPLRIIRILKPRGDAHDLSVRIDGPLREPTQFRLETQVTDAAFEPYKKFPGATGVSGDLILHEHGGEFRFDTHNATLTFPLLYTHPIAVGYAKGLLKWEKQSDHWLVTGDELRAGNADGRGVADLTVKAPLDKSKSPYLDLRVDFRDGDGSHAALYYPTKKMPPKVVAWLKHAIVSGTVTGGTLHYQGKVREFPFKHGLGKFEVVAHVRNGVVDYAPGWPRVEHGEADLLFDKTEMLITGHKGTVHGLDIGSVVVHIADLKDPNHTVTVRGKLSGPFDDAVRFLEDGPLFGKEKFATTDLHGTGQGVLDLSVDIPTADPSATQIAGRYDFLGSSLALGDGMVINDIRGSVNFTESRFTSSPISARMFGSSARFMVTTPVPKRHPQVVIEGSGDAQSTALAALLGPNFAGVFSGEVPWSAHLKVGTGAAELKLNANLTAMKSGLPVPFAKRAGAPLTLKVDSRYAGVNDQKVMFSVGNRLSGALALARRNGKARVTRSQLLVGGTNATLPATPDFVFSVRVPKLDTDAWRREWAHDQHGANATLFGLVTRVTADVGDVTLEGRHYRNVHLELNRQQPNHWFGTLASNIADGRVGIQWDDPAPHKISLDLDRLEWPREKSGGKKENSTGTQSIKPADLPELNIRARNFKYGNLSLGALQLVTEPAAGGCRIKTLQLSGPDYKTVASGTWVTVNGKQQSSYQVDLTSSDVGTTLARLQFPGHVKGGSAAIHGTLKWNGGPTDVALAGLNAQIKLKLRRGRFLDINPGAGRLFGLFNVEALTRRLTLDFSDIFSRGYSFDNITGNLTIDNGNAVTHDLELHGPAADITISGRSGIVAEDYDLKMTVMPAVGSNLAIAGGVLGTPAAGAVIYLAQKLFKKQLANIVEYKYTITGSWDDPVVSKTKSKEG